MIDKDSSFFSRISFSSLTATGFDRGLVISSPVLFFAVPYVSTLVAGADIIQNRVPM